MTDPVHIGDATLLCGESLRILDTIRDVDAVITDPPYSSGGQYRGDRAQPTRAKYMRSESRNQERLQNFAGDNRDQRAFLMWASIIFSQCYVATKPGGILLTFTDWRQLPTMSDALQAGGYVWRNVATWWKRGVRMQQGRFSSSSEYILSGSSGVATLGERSLQNVLEHKPVPTAEREHIAEKPVPLMADLVSLTPPGATVLDPFMGAGTTGVACANLGRKFIGIEQDPHHFETACRRIAAAYDQGRLFA